MLSDVGLLLTLLLSCFAAGLEAAAVVIIVDFFPSTLASECSPRSKFSLLLSSYPEEVGSSKELKKEEDLAFDSNIVDRMITKNSFLCSSFPTTSLRAALRDTAMFHSEPAL